METVTPSDDSSLNIQNDYFNKARKNHTRVTVVLTNGQRISGLIRSFDKFTLILDTRHGDQMIFKHAISTVAPSGPGDREREHRPLRPGQAERRPAPAGPGRPPQPAGPPRGGADVGTPRDTAEKPAQGEMRQRAAAAPSGKSFGNFMDLSSVAKSPGAAQPEKTGAGAGDLTDSGGAGAKEGPAPLASAPPDPPSEGPSGT